MSCSEHRRRTELVGVRFLPAERRAMEAAAARSGMSLADFIRSAVRNEMEVQR